MKFFDYVCKHPFSIILFYLGLALLGLIGLLKLEISFYPEISIPYAYVVTEFDGMPADEVEQAISIPLEDAFSSVKNIKNISSTSKRGLSIIKLEFQWNANMNVVGSDIRNKIDSVYPFLPESASRPILSFKELSDSNVMTLAVFPKARGNLSSISTIVERELKSRLISLGGIAQIKLFGYSEPEIKVDLDYQLLMTLGTLDSYSIATTIAQNVFKQPVGKIEDDKTCINIRATTDIKEIEDLARIPLDSSNGLLLGDIASIAMGEKERTSSFHFNGKEGLSLQIIKTGGSGLFSTCKKIRKAVPEYQKIYSDLFDIEIIEDNSAPLSAAIKSLVVSILAGILCSAGIMAYFVKEKHIALIIITALPASMMPVFLFMYLREMTLNIITLSALAIGTGMVFDNSIIVIDMLLKKQKEALYSYSKTILSSASAILGSTLTTVIIFIPIILIPGLMGKVFTDLAITIILFLVSSCVVSLTLTPSLFILFEKQFTTRNYELKILKKYEKHISESIKNKKRLRVITALTFLPLLLVFVIRFEVIPSVKSNNFGIKVEFPYGYSFEQYSEWAGELEDILLESGLCKNIQMDGGYDNSSLLSEVENEQDLNTFVFKIEGKEQDKILRILNASKWDIIPLSDSNFLSKLTGGNNLYSITSDKREELEKKAVLIIEKAAKDDIAVNIQRGLRSCPEYRLSLLEYSSKSDVTPYDIFTNIALGIEGQIVAEMEIDGKQTGIRLRYNRDYIDSVEKIASLGLKKGTDILHTKPLVEVKKDNNFFALTRLNRQNVLYLQYFPETENDYGAEKISSALNKSQIKDIVILFSGALIFIWFVLAIQFESFKIPFLVLLTIPPCIAGSLLLIFVTGNSLNISSFLGLMILSGTSVNSGILIISDIQKGFSISKAATSRLTTVFLTVSSTVTALLPVALFDRNPEQSCTSISLLGGLLFGTAALFLSIPVFIKGTDCDKK